MTGALVVRGVSPGWSYRSEATVWIDLGEPVLDVCRFCGREIALAIPNPADASTGAVWLTLGQDTLAAEARCLWNGDGPHLASPATERPKRAVNLTKQVVVRVSADLHAALAADAAANGRTIAQSARFLLTQALASRD